MARRRLPPAPPRFDPEPSTMDVHDARLTRVFRREIPTLFRIGVPGSRLHAHLCAVLQRQSLGQVVVQDGAWWIILLTIRGDAVADIAYGNAVSPVGSVRSPVNPSIDGPFVGGIRAPVALDIRAVRG